MSKTYPTAKSAQGGGGTRPTRMPAPTSTTNAKGVMGGGDTTKFKGTMGSGGGSCSAKGVMGKDV